MPQPRVLLFDIDGTLLNVHGAGRRAINRAFEQRFGTKGTVDHVELQGMTDPLIIKAGLSALGQPERPEMIEQILTLYVRYLQEELTETDSAELLPGVVELLDSLRNADTPTAVGLGTGNVEAGAKAKLERVRLAQYFAFGGFGSDHELRSEVLRIGAERGARYLERPLADCRTLVIGDTRRDIDAARAIGAECLAVATGGASMKDLLEYGANYVTRTLAEPGVYRYLVGHTPSPP
jgi:phosphoglycolate phosphatase-like HAD superfamily hydrolase